MSATAVLGAVDALGKIIGEPIRTISQSIAEKSRMKMQMKVDEHALKLESERTIMQLEKDREIARIDADVRKWHEEINDYIAQKEIERNKKILDAIMEYHRNMLEDYVSIMANISTMEIRLADEAHKFVIARTEDYMKLQDRAWKQYQTEIDWAMKTYPDDRERQDKAEERAFTQRLSIINSSQKNIELLSEDISRINTANSHRMTTATEYTNQIFDRWAQVIGISAISNFQTGNYIEQKNKALLK